MNLKEAGELAKKQLKKANLDMLDYLQRELNRPKPVLNLEPIADMVEISDGYHTFSELYAHRVTLFIALCRLYERFVKYKGVWRSKLHNDKTKYEGWFILGIERLEGGHITYHIPLNYWDQTEFAQTLGNAPKWDGSTSEDILEMLKNL